MPSTQPSTFIQRVRAQKPPPSSHDHPSPHPATFNSKLHPKTTLHRWRPKTLRNKKSFPITRAPLIRTIASPGLATSLALSPITDPQLTNAKTKPDRTQPTRGFQPLRSCHHLQSPLHVRYYRLRTRTSGQSFCTATGHGSCNRSLAPHDRSLCPVFRIDSHAPFHYNPVSSHHESQITPTS
jgi:hypothetical protein